MVCFCSCAAAPDYNEPFNEKWPSRPTFDRDDTPRPLPPLPPLPHFEDHNSSDGIEDPDKAFWAIWVDGVIGTYKEIVSVTACHFIQNSDERESLEVKIMQQIGKGLLAITIDLGKYSKKLLFSSEPASEKCKRIGAVIASLLSVHLAVNTLSNRQKAS